MLALAFIRLNKKASIDYSIILSRLITLCYGLVYLIVLPNN